MLHCNCHVVNVPLVGSFPNNNHSNQMTMVKPSGSKQGERHSVLPCIYPGQARSIYWRLGQVDLGDGLAKSSAQTCGLVSKYCNVACKHASKRVFVIILTYIQ